MIEAGTSKPAPFDIVIVHSFSRFFRDHFELEFYVRELAKNGVKLVSITQKMGDDPMHVMMRQTPRCWSRRHSRPSRRRSWSGRSPGRRTSGSGSKAAATAVRSPNASKSPTVRFASSALRAICFRR